jgi:hypothetical protein
MINKKYFGLVMGTCLMLALALTMSIVVQLINTGKVVFIPLLVMAAEAFIVNFIAGLIIPAPKLGDMFSMRCGAKQGTFKFTAISTLIVNAIYVTIVSFAMTLFAVGFTPVLFVAWLSIYPIVFAIGYVVVLAITPLALKLTTQIVEQ